MTAQGLHGARSLDLQAGRLATPLRSASVWHDELTASRIGLESNRAQARTKRIGKSHGIVAFSCANIDQGGRSDERSDYPPNPSAQFHRFQAPLGAIVLGNKCFHAHSAGREKGPRRTRHPNRAGINVKKTHRIYSLKERMSASATRQAWRKYPAFGLRSRSGGITARGARHSSSDGSSK